MMMSKTTFLCCNVRGLNKDAKKNTLLMELNMRRIDIAIVSDAMIGENDLNKIRQDNDYSCIYTHRQDQMTTSRWVLVLWRKNSKIQINSVLEQQDGNLLIAKAMLVDRALLICGVYGSNEDSTAI